MKFQVPQFIETEDKIIGPFTLKQFLFIAAGGALVFILFFLLQFVFWLTASLIIGTLAFALAFLKINGQPLPQILLVAIFFMSRPRLFLWHRKIEEKVFEIPSIENFKPITVEVKKRAGLDFLKNSLETGSRRVPARESPQIRRAVLRPAVDKVEPRPEIEQSARQIQAVPPAPPNETGNTAAALPILEQARTAQAPEEPKATTPSAPEVTPTVAPPSEPVATDLTQTQQPPSVPLNRPEKELPRQEPSPIPPIWPQPKASPVPEQPKESAEEVVITLNDGDKKKVKRVDY